MNFDFDPEELQRQQNEAANQKKWLAVAGGIGDALASQNSFGNFFSGKMNAPSTAVSKVAGAVADTIADPAERQAKLFEGYKQSREAKLMGEQDEASARKKDPNSRESLALKALAPRWGIEVNPEMSAYDIEQMIDPRRMMEAEASSRVSFENQKKLKQLELQGDLQKEKVKAGIEASKPKAPTAEQSKAALFAHRITNAEKVMDELAKANFDGNDRRSWAQKHLFNEAKPVDLQKLEQAQRNFINAVLRRESGAVISPEEFENSRQQYFPQAGDSAEVLEQKRQNRLDVLAGLRSEAGGALQGVVNQREVLDQEMPSPKKTAPTPQELAKAELERRKAAKMNAGVK